MRVQNVGIHAVEIYFPQTYISQEDLETYNKVGKGKYTIGLGQKEMAFVKSQEDVNSISLTAVKNLLEKYNIDPRQIGRLEIGTETLLDKSKSIKTVLMQLFKECGNHDIEGVTTINACYGGTAALFNSIAWVESSVWDGRYSIVLTTDVAVYKKGPARPTGGCGAVAMLIGPDAPISIETLRSTYIDHQYDFYKPDPRSEYPTVDGHVSINTYIGAIDNCYQGLKQKQANRGYEQINLNNVDYLCFHAPFGKMVQKAFLKLVHKDVLNGDLKIDEESLNVVKNEKYNSKPVQQILNKASQQIWKQKVLPSLAVGSRIGNIYTGSLYAGLVSLISDKSINLLGKRIFMFSYGSGLASSMFCFRVNRDISHIQYSLNTIERLNQRIKYDIQTFEDIMAAREAAFGTKNFKPQINFDELADGTYYLTEVDDMWRRVYQRKPVKWGKTVNIGNSQSVELSSTASSSQNPTTKVSPLAGEDVILNNAVDRLSALKSTMYQSKHVENRSIRNKSQSIWNGFYKKTLQERLDQLKKIDAEFNSDENLQGGLELQKADIMVENCVGKMALPMGLGLNFKMNDQEMQVPMVIEEPSVIAAASSAGKFIGSSGSGFNTCSTEPVMIGQVQLLDIATEEQIQSIRNNKDEIIEKANEACQSMVKRGGGVKDLRVRQLMNQKAKL